MQRILLLQARDPGDPMLQHELDCFVARTALEVDRIEPLNMAATPILDWPRLDGFDGMMVGGSGDYSLVKGGFEWHLPMLGYVREAIDRGLPFFGSCFGFQAVVQTLGGELASDPQMSEVGTFEVELTDAGVADDFFGALPHKFPAQLGHNDSAIRMPDEVVNLAGSVRCAHQALRMPGKPVWATQFHPELDADANMTRYVRYLTNYADRPMEEEEAWESARAIHKPSPDANALLSRFLEVLP